MVGFGGLDKTEDDWSRGEQGWCRPWIDAGVVEKGPAVNKRWIKANAADAKTRGLSQLIRPRTRPAADPGRLMSRRCPAYGIMKKVAMDQCN